MAEREGFEPSIPVSQYTRLAGERLRPTRPSLRKTVQCSTFYVQAFKPRTLNVELAFYGGGSRIRTHGTFVQRFSRPPPSTTRPSLRKALADLFQPPHVRPQRLRDHHRAVGLLEVFQDGHHGPPHCQAGTVQGMDEFGFCLVILPEADGCPAGLKILKIAAGGYLPVGILCRAARLLCHRSWPPKNRYRAVQSSTTR